MFLRQSYLKAFTVWLGLLFTFSCATYNAQISNYYEHLGSGEYHKAERSIDHVRLLKAKRNRLLYLLEKGKVYHLLKQYDSSNQYFNLADNYIEDYKVSAKDIALGNLMNPMMQAYRGEDFEKFMVHYYKALNYFQLGQYDEGIVEARRISLQSYSQQDKTNGKENRYSDDAFSLMLQGILYEATGDINNAFISYRNAADVFISHDYLYYGIQMPLQLKKDVIRLARENGFSDEQQRYESIFGLEPSFDNKPEGGELILFWENGLAPVKQQQDFFFSLVKDGGGNFVFVDDKNTFSIPFDFSYGTNKDDLKLDNLRSIRVAFPKYEEIPLFYRSAIVTIDSSSFQMEQAQDINELAFATLKERFLKEMASTLTRLAIKKLAEAAVRPKKDDKHKDEKEAMALAIQIFSFASEKADTRNWQSLPHTISYARIPLSKGENNLTVSLDGKRKSTIQLSVIGNGRLQIQNLSTVR